MSQLSQPLSVGYVAPNTDVTANKLNKNNEEDQASVYPHSPQVSILIKLLSEIREKSLSCLVLLSTSCYGIYYCSVKFSHFCISPWTSLSVLGKETVVEK